jgi:hypothetical protein
MILYVNDIQINVLQGTTIMHALINTGLLEQIVSGRKVYDEWGNEVGLDGALSEGIKIYVR